MTRQSPPPENDTWEAMNLRSLLAKAKDPETGKALTQIRLAELARIERSRLNGILRATSRLTLTYAERLAPHLGVKHARDLLAPQEQEQKPESPIALLRRLSKTVARQQEEIEELQGRVESLENSGGSARRERKVSR